MWYTGTHTDARIKHATEDFANKLARKKERNGTYHKVRDRDVWLRAAAPLRYLSKHLLFLAMGFVFGVVFSIITQTHENNHFFYILFKAVEKSILFCIFFCFRAQKFKSKQFFCLRHIMLKFELFIGFFSLAHLPLPRREWNLFDAFIYQSAPIDPLRSFCLL